MALGDTYNNNEKKNYSPSVTSGYRFSNPESTIDKTSLSFSFWNKLLKISIAPKKETGNDDIAFDYENAGSVYLSHTKALILYKEICKFMEEYKTGNCQNNVGVSSGKDGLLYVCTGKEFNAEGPCLVIRKINEKGECISTFVYEFRTGLHNSIFNYEEKSKNFDARFYDLIELEVFANLLNEYYRSMSMAVAYSIQESAKYDTSRMNTKLKIIAEKLGVEFNKPGSNYSRASNNSFFSNAKPNSNHGTSNSSYSSYNAPSNDYEQGSLDDLD